MFTISRIYLPIFTYFLYFYFQIGLEVVKLQMEAPKKQEEEIEMTSKALDDISERLEDLEKNSETSQSTSSRALGLISDLTYQTMQQTEVNIEEINYAEKLILETIAMSQDQLNSSSTNMNTADAEMQVKLEGILEYRFLLLL